MSLIVQLWICEKEGDDDGLSVGEWEGEVGADDERERTIVAEEIGEKVGEKEGAKVGAHDSNGIVCSLAHVQVPELSIVFNHPIPFVPPN